MKFIFNWIRYGQQKKKHVLEGTTFGGNPVTKERQGRGLLERNERLENV